GLITVWVTSDYSRGFVQSSWDKLTNVAASCDPTAGIHGYESYQDLFANQGEAPQVSGMRFSKSEEYPGRVDLRVSIEYPELPVVSKAVLIEGLHGSIASNEISLPLETVNSTYRSPNEGEC